jgi:phosphopantothenoylcysteine decarboxylase/phosphopantothenate--cysteine ligase
MASTIRCLVSAGPTREFFDPVRFLSNPSSGKMGFALAKAAAQRGWQVELVHGPVQLDPLEAVKMIPVTTGAEMEAALSERFPHCDLLIMTAAVMDYRPREVSPVKIKKDKLRMVIEMEPVTDILAHLAQQRERQHIVGFAAETDHLEANALKKLKGKGAHWIVGNRIGGPDGAFGKDVNSVLLLSRDGTREAIGPMSKEQLAEELLNRFALKMAEDSQEADGPL